MKYSLLLLTILGLFLVTPVMALRFASAESLGLSGAEREAYESKIIDVELRKREQLQQKVHQSRIQPRIQLSDAEKKEITERKARMKLREEADRLREEANKKMAVQAGDTFGIEMYSNYMHPVKIIKSDENYIQFLEQKEANDSYADPKALGASILQEFRFKALKPGIAEIVFGEVPFLNNSDKTPVRLKTSTIIIK